jgi:K+-transporting ATPase ATPase A chain
MSAAQAAWGELGFFVVVLTLLTPYLGGYLAAVFGRCAAHVVRRTLGTLETGIYRACRIDPAQEMSWTAYLERRGDLHGGLDGRALRACSARSSGCRSTRSTLPICRRCSPSTSRPALRRPRIGKPIPGESALGYLAQMAGLAWQNFRRRRPRSRGCGRRDSRLHALVGVCTLGNFWVDLTRSWLYVLLPISAIGAVLLIWQGTPQNFAPYATVTTLEGAHQTITGGPMASQTIIEQLGVNGGGLRRGQRSVAEPQSDPADAILLQFFAMFLLGAALTNMFGRMIGNVRHGWVLYGVMLGLFLGGFAVVWGSEHGGNPLLHQLGIAGANMEGKEVRFGDVSSALSVTVATDTSSGAANVAYDSLMPLSVLVAMLNMQIGEIIFGGVR